MTKTEELEERDTVSPAPAETTQTKSKKKRKSKLVDSKFEDEAERPPATPQVEPDEKKVTKKKKKAAKTTTNPPPDTSEHMVDLLPPPVAQEEVPEKITIAVISKKGKKSKKVRDRSELYRVKDEDIDQETSKPVSTKKTSESKIKKKKSHKKAKDTTLEKCDDLVFVSAHVDTRKPPSTEVKRKGKKSPLSRRKSEDHGQILGSDEVDFDPISTDHRSTSYTEDLNKEQKQFRNELRQTSKSQYDMAITPAASEERLVMKKSGVVMKKKGGGQRPTIFGQSSSPEPEEEEETIVQKEAVVPATITTRGKAKGVGHYLSIYAHTHTHTPIYKAHKHTHSPKSQKQTQEKEERETDFNRNGLLRHPYHSTQPWPCPWPRQTRSCQSQQLNVESSTS